MGIRGSPSPRRWKTPFERRNSHSRSCTEQTPGRRYVHRDVTEWLGPVFLSRLLTSNRKNYKLGRACSGELTPFRIRNHNSKFQSEKGKVNRLYRREAGKMQRKQKERWGIQKVKHSVKKIDQVTGKLIGGRLTRYEGPIRPLTYLSGLRLGVRSLKIFTESEPSRCCFSWGTISRPSASLNSLTYTPCTLGAEFNWPTTSKSPQRLYRLLKTIIKGTPVFLLKEGAGKSFHKTVVEDRHGRQVGNGFQTRTVDRRIVYKFHTGPCNDSYLHAWGERAGSMLGPHMDSSLSGSPHPLDSRGRSPRPGPIKNAPSRIDTRNIRTRLDFE